MQLCFSPVEFDIFVDLNTVVLVYFILLVQCVIQLRLHVP